MAFAYYLLEALYGTPAMLADKRVTVSEVNRHVAEKVKVWAFANRKQQSPQISSTIFNEVVLTLPTVEDLSPSPSPAAAVVPTIPSPQPARKPLIMVIIPEYFHRSSILFPAGETEIIRLLVEQDFPVIDQHQIQHIRYNDEAKRAAQGDVDAAVALGNQFKAEIVIVGEAVSQRIAGRMPGNIIACNAQLVVKAIQTDTAKILATHSMTDKGLDLTEESASKKALTNVGGKIADYLIREIDQKWNEMTTNLSDR